MTEAVIVSTARSPIGRAGKGSLASMRPDDLATQIVRAALDKVPSLDPHDVDDLMMGCGQPGGESGFNIGRKVAVQLGYDFMPGTTVNRYCSSSLQTSRMAFHAIKAGEGAVFISAGVETVSRFAHGSSDGWPDSQNPLFADAAARTADRAANGSSEWHDPRDDGLLPDAYIAMGQTAENLALFKNVSREDRMCSASGRRTWRRRRSSPVSGRATSPQSRCRTAPSCPPTTARGLASPTRLWRASSRCSGPTGASPPATAARSTTAPPRS